MTTATTEALKLTARINRIEPSATMAVVAEADKLRSQGIDVVDFGAGEPHFATPQHIKDAAIAAIEGNFTKYTAVAGTAELRDAIVHRHAVDFDSDYRREEAIASTGGKHALFNAIQVLVDHGDEVILPVPYWVSFKDIVRYAGGNCVLLESDEAQGFRVTADMVAQRITPRTKVMLHLANGGDNGTFRWWFDNIVAQGVQFDVIGASYYPYWHGTFEAFQANLNDLAVRYGKPMILAETAYPFTPEDKDGWENIILSAEPYPGYPATPDGQTAFLRKITEIRRAVPDRLGLGVFYWEATWTGVPGNGWDPADPASGNGWENQALFDFTNRPLPALREFGQGR